MEKKHNRYVRRAHYDTYEGVIDAYEVVDMVTGSILAHTSASRASYLARKWNIAEEKRLQHESNAK